MVDEEIGPLGAFLLPQAARHAGHAGHAGRRSRRQRSTQRADAPSALLRRCSRRRTIQTRPRETRKS